MFVSHVPCCGFCDSCPQEKGASASGERRTSITKRTTSQARILLLLVVVMLNVDGGSGNVDLRNSVCEILLFAEMQSSPAFHNG